MRSLVKGLAARVLALVGVCVLAGCVGPVPKIDVAPSALLPLATVAVIQPPEPHTYTVVNFGHPGMAFGLIGGLIAAADQTDKQDRLSAAFKGQGAGFSKNVAEQVVAELTKAGYSTRVEQGPWQLVDGNYSISFDKIESSADAVLVIAPTIIGFITTSVAADYMPTMTTVVTLLGKDRKVPLYRGFHAYGWVPPAEGWRGTAPKSTFANFDKLMVDTKASAAALNVAGAALAVSIASDLKRGTASRPTELDDLRDLLPKPAIQ